ncbi:MAG: helix-turn-helix transcriptional regulator [Clostridiales bacterium]|nr:helix-turn-helix transcriptional regulator [Clostridiales bacterium]
MKNEFKTEIIESYLKENNLSKSKFCKLCGISTCTLNRVMNNKNCRISAFFKIAKAVKVQVYQLFSEN